MSGQSRSTIWPKFGYPRLTKKNWRRLKDCKETLDERSTVREAAIGGVISPNDDSFFFLSSCCF